MVRTQIYHTKQEHAGPKLLTVATGKKKSELIREAVDRMLDQSSKGHNAAILDRVAGMWKDRTDLPDFDKIHAEWDRSGRCCQRRHRRGRKCNAHNAQRKALSHV